MNKNIIKIKQSVLFVAIGLVTLGSFSTTFSYWRTIRNNTQYQASGTIYYIGCANSTFSLAPGATPFREFNACLVDRIDATVFPNWNAPSTAQGPNAFFLNIVKKADPKSGAVNVTWNASQVSGSALWKDTRANIAEGAAIGMAGTIIGSGIGATVAATTSLTRDALKQQGTAKNNIWNIESPNGVYGIRME